MGFALLSAPILARGLGTEGRGLYAAATCAFGLAPILIGLGVPTAVRYRAAQTTADVRGIVRSVAYLMPIVSVLGALLGLALVNSLLRELSAFESYCLVISMASCAFFLWLLCLQSVLIAHGRYVEIAATQLLQGIFTPIFVFVLFVTDRLSLGLAILTYSVATCAGALAVTLMARSYVFGRVAQRVSPVSMVKDGTRFAAAQVAEVSTTTVPMLVAPVAIGATQAGLLSVAVTAAAVPNAIAFVVTPVVFARSALAKSPRDAVAILEKGLRSALVGSLIVGLPMALAAPFLVPTVFGAEFSESVVPTMIMVLMCPCAVLMLVCAQWFASRSRSLPQSVGQIVGVLFSLLGLFLIAPRFGATGGAVVIGLGSLAGVTILGRWSGLRIVSLLRPKGLITDCFGVIVRGRI